MMLSLISGHRTALCSRPPSQDNLLIHQIAPKLPTRSLFSPLPPSRLPPAYNSPAPPRAHCALHVKQKSTDSAFLRQIWIIKLDCWAAEPGLIIKFYEGGLAPIYCMWPLALICWIGWLLPSHYTATLSQYWSASSLLVSAFKIN